MYLTKGRGLESHHESNFRPEGGNENSLINDLTSLLIITPNFTGLSGVPALFTHLTALPSFVPYSISHVRRVRSSGNVIQLKFCCSTKISAVMVVFS